MIHTFEYDLELERLADAGELWLDTRLRGQEIDRVSEVMRRFRRAEKRDRRARKRGEL